MEALSTLGYVAVAIFLAYVVARVVSAAFFKSKSDFERRQ